MSAKEEIIDWGKTHPKKANEKPPTVIAINEPVTGKTESILKDSKYIIRTL
jgi:hypothetical protein